MNRPIGELFVEYDDVGLGDSVVFVRGLAEDRRSWSTEMDRLETDRRLVCYDLRGHVKTTIGETVVTLDQLATDLVDLIEILTEPATCVGFSLGGTMVLQAAASQPELFPHAIVLGTSSVVGKAAADFYTRRIALVESGFTAQIAEAVWEDTRAAVTSTTVELGALVCYRLRAISKGTGYVNAARAMRRLHDQPLTPALSRVRCHVDVVGAENDRFCPRKDADILLSGLGDATYHEVTGAGHLMTLISRTPSASSSANY